MSDKNNDKKHYSAADIARYLSGDMPSPEMNALEKAALDDPFLQDALDGYALLDTAASRQNLAELQQRLTQRTRRKIIQPAWWKMAAAVLLLAGGVSLAYMLLFNKPSRQMAMRKDAIKEEEMMPGNTINPSPGLTDTVLPAAPPESTGMKVAPQPALLQREETATISSRGTKQETANRESDIAAETIAGRKEDTPRNIPLTGAFKAEKREKNALLKEKSRDTFHSPAPARQNMQEEARRQVPPRAESTATVPAREVEGKLSGLEITRNNQIPADTLSEIAVSAYGRRRKKAVAAATSIKANTVISAPDAEPVAGKTAYLEYLAKNKPAPGAGKAPQGDLIVSFTVTPRGKLTRFKVEKSLAPLIDQEIIRLIKDGPEWRTLENKRGRVKLVITY